MADKKDADPLAIWREMVAQWETNVNALANKTMASDEYSGAMHGAMGATLRMQETVKQFMTAYLAATNLPSRAEVLALGERLGEVEARLDRMNALLQRIADSQTNGKTAAAPPRPRPPRTKSPPGAEPSA
ncbi:MAG TPA: poly(R)-hydroxyalkanoic acid synthase subunit PhaE [Candidatus Elarobacter sp.]|nr:poly(R)-hydroxyalkanoic acid synthase subunit PhaE [Candidatus Elarobacter sp.]